MRDGVELLVGPMVSSTSDVRSQAAPHARETEWGVGRGNIPFPTDFTEDISTVPVYFFTISFGRHR